MGVAFLKRVLTSSIPFTKFESALSNGNRVSTSNELKPSADDFASSVLFVVGTVGKLVLPPHLISRR